MRKRNTALRAEDALRLWDAAGSAAAAGALTLKCTLMTPMYGGGVKPGEVDQRMPVRPGAVRGHLRFWWRLLNGVGRKPSDLFDAESALWGGIASKGARASRVALHVRGDSDRPPAMVKAKDKGRRFPTYAFILDPGADPELLQEGYEFTVTVRFAPGATDAQREQVIEALRWWASFGGVGARTRRGLGSFRVADGDSTLEPVTCAEVKGRRGRMVLGPERKAAIDAWRVAVEALKNFRQGEGVGRNQGRARPGRSRWPEADAIRRRTGHCAPGHEPTHPLDRYPRAAFGLPIVFQFKDRIRGDPPGPSGKSLKLGPTGREGDRMASPLILRSYFDGTRHRPLALLLPRWEERISVPVNLDVDNVGRLGPAWPEDSDERKKCAALVKPMDGRGADALTAFLHYFEHDGRGERYARASRGRGGR